jgi:hypothetical protein
LSKVPEKSEGSITVISQRLVAFSIGSSGFESTKSKTKLPSFIASLQVIVRVPPSSISKPSTSPVILTISGAVVSKINV